MKQKGHRFVLDGLSEDIVLDYKKLVFDCLNNRQKVSVNILKDEDVHVLETEEWWVLIVDVPRADLRLRPIYINNNPDEVYKRDYEGDYKCTPDEIRRMYAEANIFELPQDARILQGFSFKEDIDETSFREYRQLFANLQPTHPWASLVPEELMRKLGGIRKDRKTGVEGLTLAHEKLLVLAACVSDGYVSNYRLQFVLDRHPVEITQLLKELCEDGLLKASGIGKGTKYKLNVTSKVSGNVASKVSPERNVSNRTLRLYRAIQETCIDFMPLIEIAPKVNRKLRYLKNTVIPDMVTKGLLERKYPNIPSHPDQQYRCVKFED